MITNIFAWIIVGGLAGFVASKLVKGHSSGAFSNILTGVFGALLGGFVLKLFNSTADFTGFNWASFFVALLGSVILLVILGATRKK